MPASRSPAPEMMVKQYVAVVQGRWCKFMVFRTGSDKYYLFAALDRFGCQTGLQFPVAKAALRTDLRSALSQGWGNAVL